MFFHTDFLLPTPPARDLPDLLLPRQNLLPSLNAASLGASSQPAPPSARLPPAGTLLLFTGWIVELHSEMRQASNFYASGQSEQFNVVCDVFCFQVVVRAVLESVRLIFSSNSDQSETLTSRLDLFFFSSVVLGSGLAPFLC